MALTEKQLLRLDELETKARDNFDLFLKSQ